jgi:hypothetical protein
MSDKNFDVLRGDPSNWTYSITDIPANSTGSFVYMKIARAKVWWHRDKVVNFHRTLWTEAAAALAKLNNS